MKLAKDLHRRLIEKYGPVLDLKENPDSLQDIVEEIAMMFRAGPVGAGKEPSASPFGVSWMDSWVAHWVYNEDLRAAEGRNKELANILKSLTDLKFNERIGEIRRFIRDFPHALEPPDGGPPEPGTPSPPAGPAALLPPDGGPPEPGTPPAGPASIFEPPDGGTPEPGVPPTGPDAGFLRENPWILYWFISIKAPLLLDVIDAHMTRRLNELRAASR